MPSSAPSNPQQRHVRINSPTRPPPTIISPAGKGKVQSIMHHLTMPPSLDAGNPGPVVRSDAWERGGSGVEEGVVGFWKGKCDGGKWMVGREDKQGSGELEGVANACFSYAVNVDGNEEKVRRFASDALRDWREAGGLRRLMRTKNDLHAAHKQACSRTQTAFVHTCLWPRRSIMGMRARRGGRRRVEFWASI